MSPALKLRVAKVEGRDAVLRPAAPLRQSQIYRFELRRADGTAEAAWAVQAAWPLHVAHTLPGDSSSSVPRDTGIEVTFDQPGVRLTDVRKHVTISPDVAGRWEQHGATFAFVPSKPLARNTLYTVTMRRGLPVAETGMTLDETRVFRFETTGGAVSRAHVTVARSLFDARRASVPRSACTSTSRRTHDGSRRWTSSSTACRASRPPSRPGAGCEAAPDWTVRSSTTPVKTAKLPEVLEGSVRVTQVEDGWRGWFRLPTRLRSGLVRRDRDPRRDRPADRPPGHGRGGVLDGHLHPQPRVGQRPGDEPGALAGRG